MEIALTQGFKALIDKADQSFVGHLKWHASIGRKGRVVAMHSFRDPEGRRRNVLMHRFILGVGEGQLVDHVNGDPLDNRRKNLRLATAQQNCANKVATGASRFLGVFRSASRWSASIHPYGLSIRLGDWGTEELAAAAYNRAAIRIHGEFARLNDVPPLTEEQWRGLIDSKRRRIADTKKHLSALGEAW